MKLTHNLGIFECSATPVIPGARFAYANGKSVWTRVQDKVAITPECIETFAKIARDGGKAVWNNSPVIAGSPTIFDVEHPDLETLPPNEIAGYIHAFKAIAPDVPVGVYGYAGNPEGVTPIGALEEMQSFGPDVEERFTRIYEYRRPAIEASDFVNFDTYLLSAGTKWITRDLESRRNQANALRKMFPGKPIIVWAWGRYHDAWQKPDDQSQNRLPKYVVNRYVKMLRETMDGVIVFENGSERDVGVNELLNAALSSPWRTILPIDRKPNWATEFIVSGAKTLTAGKPTTLFLRDAK